MNMEKNPSWVCPKCKGDIYGTYKQFYTQSGDVETRVEWRCDKCGEVW